MDQKKSPEIDVTHMYDHVFDKGEKEIQQRKESFTNKWCWKNWIAFILVSCDYCNKVTQTPWLKTIEIDSFSILQMRSAKSRC